MAVSIPAGVTDYLQRTSGGFLNPVGSSTVMLWVKYAAIPTSPNYQLAYALLDDPGTYTDFVTIDSNDLQHNHIAFPGTDINSASVTAATWYHLAWVQTGTGATSGQRLYVNGTSIATTSKDRSAFTIGFEMLGNDTFATGNCQIGMFRSWGAPLTQNQIRAEMVSATAVRSTDLFMDTPLIDDLLDISGNGRDWTEVGTVPFVAGPQPTNATADTAIALTIPYTATATITAPAFASWYSYAAAADGVIGLFGYGASILPRLEVFSPDSTTNFLAFNNSALTINQPIQVPTFNGVDYFFRFTPTVSVADTLAVTTLAAPTTAPALGSFIINDDTVGYPLAFLSSTSSEMLSFRLSFPTGEGGDVLSTSGRMLFEDFPNGTLVLYENDLTGPLATITFGPGGGGQRVLVRANQNTQTFYAGQRNFTAHPAFRKITADGTDTALTTTGANGMTAFSVNDDETLLYLAGTPGPTDSNIRQWDITGSAFLTDLVAAVASYRVSDMLLLEDDTLLAMYVKTSSPGDVRVVRYDLTGATLNTYTLASAVTLPSVTSGYRLTTALDSPTSFWAWFHLSDGGIEEEGISRFQNVVVADGSILESIDYYEFEVGIYSASASASPGARFGPSSSCPFMLMRTGSPTPGPGTPEEFLIRRERWFPVINQENQRMTFSMLQVDLQAGNGLTVGQGENPLLELDWSDDAGWTWSNIRFLPTGRIGQYNRRAIARVLGQSRQRVFRIAVSDPVQWVILDGYMQVKGGTS